ncbi:hypothetical protein PAXRUDRAFT_19732 [Paxillus rubicundulus Ve08.2h10]|uniref:Unplaced genomic scaffold scaffold_3912, whole genome shotgun sequence n=1 Tax=Paxillus rubicundulus Ve08.2h10 TaxID=930991 RepID=A0A0D0CGW3_9AGAM|nr:hypothetical protein PAXRUDRAFT_19811 [Paxillus rubicundulus Ve08.2h10]KIK74579.1 hypothetical protein PAXRUDRAFT_19732 [Paxillus rubicundulus Ve08.2h10]
MSNITKITNIETATAIRKFNPSLPDNRILGDSLDIVAAVCTLAIKIQCSATSSGKLQTECWGAHISSI